MAAFEPLTEALLKVNGIAFFEDGDLLRDGLVEALIGLVYRLEHPVLFEGTPSAMVSLFEDEEELDEYFVRMPVDEPDVDRTQEILRSLFESEPDRLGVSVKDDAIEEAAYLGQRFLSRSHFPRKALDLLSQSAAGAQESPLDRDRVLARFCELHATPSWLVDPKEPLDYTALETRLRNEILGQPEAVAAASQLVATMKTGLSDVRRPFGTFLFTGPTGVGKTHLAQTLAQILFGERDRMVRLNMGDFATDHGSKLFGEPDAYSLSSRRGILTQTLLGRPFAVLLLDELEKAHPAIMDRFLPLMDEGVFTNGAGESISCRSMIVIATTNAGAEVYRGAGLGFAGEQDLQEKKRKVELRVRDVFRFEFLNRFDAVVHFDPLSREACRTIARRELEGLRERIGLRRYGLSLAIDESVLDWLAVNGYHPDYGARFMKRTIERTVTRVVAEAIVRRQPPPGSQVELLVRGRRVHCRIDVKKRGGAEEPVAVAAEGPHGAPKKMTLSDVSERAKPLLFELEERERERSGLLERMGEQDFWTSEDHADVLERFRELDVWVAMGRRFAGRIETWREDLMSSDALAQAADAVLRWEERLQLAGPGALWLLIAAADAHEPASDWLNQLVRIYLQYCRRCELEAHVEAIEPRRQVASKVVIEVEGPGAQHLLSAEEGMHRLRRTERPDALARVALIPRGEGPLKTEGRTIRDRSGRQEALGLEILAETALHVPRLGLASRLYGRSAATLIRLAADLEERLEEISADTAPARLHGGPSGVVTDPRTGVSVPARQVEKGRLEAFLDAWRALPQGSSSMLTWSGSS